MKRLCYILMLMVLACAVSCIEEYNELPAGAGERMVVIEGQIVSDRECAFTLCYTAALGDEAIDSRQPVSGAQIMVKGTNGELFAGYEQPDAPGHYMIAVGKLNPEVSYYLEVKTQGTTYSSQPMQPLDAPDITELKYEQPREDRVIDFYVSTSDPKGAAFFKWEYDETWEIYTPYLGLWDYVFDNPREFEQWNPSYSSVSLPQGHYEMVKTENLKNHGWSKYHSREHVLATNADYGQGAISRLCLYQRDPDDNRYQMRYLTQLHQMSISAEEYEYLHLMSTQSSQMGGLFTPMPTELPGNIFSEDGSRAVGYVGVRGHVAEAEIYIDRKDVGHRDLYRVVIVPDSLVEEPPFMLKRGFKVIDYSPLSGEVSWSSRWVIDCTDPFWGASVERPEYWKDAN